jgi:hypothetical protein
MARFHVIYNTARPRPGLDSVIDADTYKVDAKFFTFLKDKEVVRTLKVDIVVQIRRMEDDEEVDEEEDPEPLDAPLSSTSSTDLDDLIAASKMDEKYLDDLVAAGSESMERLLADMPSVDDILRDLDR